MAEVLTDRTVAGGGFARIGAIGFTASQVSSITPVYDIVAVSDEKPISADRRKKTEFYEVELTNEVTAKTAKTSDTVELSTGASTVAGDAADSITLKFITDVTIRAALRSLMIDKTPVAVVIGNGRKVSTRAIAEYAYLMGYLEGDFEHPNTAGTHEYDLKIVGGTAFTADGAFAHAGFNTAMCGGITPSGNDQLGAGLVTPTDLVTADYTALLTGSMVYK